MRRGRCARRTSDAAARRRSAADGAVLSIRRCRRDVDGASTDTRVGASNEASICVDPKNPDWLIVTSQVTYKSEDGGKSWVPFKGAPGGDDYQYAWINPNNTDIILRSPTRARSCRSNGGESWSSWYNQPTAAMYHITTDNAFPYRVCGGQQDSGSACVASRGNDGAITFREWHPAGIEEYGYAAPDPLDPDIVYGSKEVTKYDRRTGQVSNVGPLGGRGAAAPRRAPRRNRQVRTQPIVFSMVDSEVAVLRAPTSCGRRWTAASPGSRSVRTSPARPTRSRRASASTPSRCGRRPGRRQRRARHLHDRAVVQRRQPHLDRHRRRRRSRRRRTAGCTGPTSRRRRSASYWKVFMMEPGRFDPLPPTPRSTRCASTTRIRISSAPTTAARRGRRSSTAFPAAPPVSAIREDVEEEGAALRRHRDAGLRVVRRRRSLGVAAAEHGALVGARPAGERRRPGRRHARARHLDPRRHHAAAADRREDARTAMRAVQAAGVAARPLEHQHRHAAAARRAADAESAGGGHHRLLPEVRRVGPVVLEIFDAGGKLVRHYSSADPPRRCRIRRRTRRCRSTGIRPPQALSAKAGMHRFTWDVHYQPLPGGGGGRGGLPIAAVPFNTVPAPTTPWVPPGTYTVKLTVNGKTLSQPLTVKQDPRVKTPALVMQQVYTLSTAALSRGGGGVRGGGGRRSSCASGSRRCSRARQAISARRSAALSKKLEESRRRRGWRRTRRTRSGPPSRRLQRLPRVRRRSPARRPGSAAR